MDEIEPTTNTTKDEQSSGKSDLRQTKTELFNKLIGSQSSQQMIVTTAQNKNNGAENLRRANSLAEPKQLPSNDQSQPPANQQDEFIQVYQSSNQTNNNNSNQSLQHQAHLLLPDELKREPVAFSGSRSRWYTNEEVASILTNFTSHPEWQTNELQVRPKSGAVLLYSREKVRYRQDGYCWKKRKNGRTTREDHMKLKVQGIECIYGCYVHSAILPTFHRRCYWLLQNPDIVLVHYLNQPPDDQNKMMITFNSSLLEADTRRSWTNEEIIEEIGSVFGGISQIQHTLNINFPTTTTIIQQQQQNQQQQQQPQQHYQVTGDTDRMIESSPQSQQSQATTTSEAMNEQVDMTILDSQQQDRVQQNQNQSADSIALQQDSMKRNLEEDELMAISNDNNDNIQISTTSSTSANDNQRTLQGDGHANGHGLQNHRDESINMNFDIVVDCARDGNVNNDEDCRPSGLDCFDFASSSGLNPSDDRQAARGTAHNTSTIVNSNNNKTTATSTTTTTPTTDSVNYASISEQSQSNKQMARQLEQNPCSPVTQIYNKIVDDIETYALPLETDFESGHHHHHHHHSMSLSTMPVQTISTSETCERDQHHHVSRPQQQQTTAQSQYQNQSDDTRDVLDKDQSSCSMDLGSCNPFADHSNPIDAQDEPQHGAEDDNLLLSEFNLQNTDEVDQVADDLGANVVDSLTNVDDLRDLMIGISSNDGAEQENLLDTNSLDLFNFKPSASEQKRQQLDVKSTTSDTDALNRLSPMDHVPRCNSTGNAIMQPLNQLQSHHHHLSNNYLICNQNSNLVESNHFRDYQNHNEVRSASTNPSSSTSCSLSPSSSSLRTGAQVQSRSTFINPSPCMTATTSSFMKLPLQQRQKSEQKEPSTSVLNSLLPKAVSLDGSDLSVSANHRLQISPLIGYDDLRDQSNLLLIPSTHCQQHQSLQQQQLQQQSSQSVNESSSSRHYGPQQASLGASVSPTIPMDNPSEILVSASNNFDGSLYNCELHKHKQSSPNHQVKNIPTKPTNSSNLLPIIDYVPNWCNITGGAKVIIVGNWSSLIPKTGTLPEQHHQQQQRNCDDSDSQGFFALFDNLMVQATLIQDNLLRCYAPSHEQGFITLKVLYMNRVVSDQVLFEMRPSCVQASDGIANLHPRDSSQHSGGQNSFTDVNQNSGGNNTQQQQYNQHRNSTSNNLVTGGTTFSNQKSQLSPSSHLMSSDNPKVLTLAENIISAMHKKNHNHSINNRRATDCMLANSLDMKKSDHYMQNCYQQQCHRSNSQRRMCGSRSLSRDSEPSSYGYGLNLGFMDNDPYWHRGPTDSEPMQPLTVMTDFLTATRPNSMAFGQKRHSSGSAGLLSHQHQSTFSPYVQSQPVGYPAGGANFNHMPAEWPGQTETSSSGLGSVVSSLSPSSSSLHSPTSACAANNRDVTDTGANGHENQSPCSCGRQSFGTPTSADFCEYFQASAKTEESFASLTLNDREQQELYEAAKVIQKAYRTYRGRKRQASELLVSTSTSLVMAEQERAESGGGLLQAPLFPQLVSDFSDLLNSPVMNDVENQVDKQQQARCSGIGITQQHYSFMSQQSLVSSQQQQQQQQQPVLVKCYRDREMQAATIIQAYYRRYRQYVHYKRQQQTLTTRQSTQQQQCHPTSSGGPTLISNTAACERRSPQGDARLVVDTMSIVIDKATTSHVDRKRFKTAMLMSSSSAAGNNNSIEQCAQQQQQLVSAHVDDQQQIITLQ